MQIILDVVSVVSTIINVIIVIQVFRLTRKDICPKLSLIPSIEDAMFDYDRALNEEVDSINFNQTGFPEEGKKHPNKLWKILIKNYSDLPAVNVEMKYSIVVKRAEFKKDRDILDVCDEHFVDYLTIPRKIHFDYIPAQAEMDVHVLYLTGCFLCADLIIDRLSSDERTYIKKPVKIGVYEHPNIHELEDSNDYRKLYGLYK